jgi:hypothetical protein
MIFNRLIQRSGVAQRVVGRSVNAAVLALAEKRMVHLQDRSVVERDHVLIHQFSVRLRLAYPLSTATCFFSETPRTASIDAVRRPRR